MKKTDELERLLIGALLDFNDPRRALEASGLTVEEFSDSSLRTVFDFTRRRVERHLEVSAIDVWGTATKIGKLGDDDLGWLQSLEAGNSLDEGAFLRIAEELRSIVRSRRLAARLRELAADVDGNRSSLSAISGQLGALSQQLDRSYQANRTAENDPGEVLDAWEARVKAGKTFQIPSGIPLFDEDTGGWVPNLNLVVGKPSIGKSAFAASSIEAQLDLGQRVAIFGLEDGHRWISRRLMARDLNMPVRAVGSKPLDREGWDRAADVAQKLSAKLKNLFVYKWSGARAVELVRYARSWILNEGVEAIWLDNATSVRHGGTGRPGQRDNDFRIQVAESVEMFRDVAENYGVPLIVLCHTTREYEEKRGNAPPELTDVAEGAAFERFARMFVGLWSKRWSSELRCTVQKNIEGAPGLTFGFERHVEQALIDVRSGRRVDVREEAKQERNEKKGAKLEQEVADALLRAQMKEQARKALKGSTPAPALPATTTPAPEPQLDLLAGKKEEPKP